MEGQIRTYANWVYKYRNNNLPAFEEPILTDFKINIPLLEDTINIDDFIPYYAENDINQEHPIYIYDRYENSKRVKLNLLNDKEKLFLFAPDMQQGEKILGMNYNMDTGLIEKANTTGERYPSPDNYNKVIVKRGNNDYPTIYQYAVSTSSSTTSLYTIRRQLDALINDYNNKISGLSCVYNEEKDAFLAPICYYNDNAQDMVFGYFDKEDNEIAEFRGTIFYNGFSNTDMLINPGFMGPSKAYKDEENLKYSFQLRDKSGALHPFYFPNISRDSSSTISGTKYCYAGIYKNRAFNSSIPMFLKDKKNKYWIMRLCEIPHVFNNYRIPDSFMYSFIVLMKVEDLPDVIISQKPSSSMVGGVINTSLSWHDWENDTSFSENINIILDKMFQIKPGENYDDGGADIVGPGDPYGDISNVGEIIGGNSDLTENIEADNAIPNTSYTSFGTSTGYFGSYSLTNNDLKNYTDTLRLLYEKSTTPIIGVATSTIADRMNNAITGLIMIPKVIPSGYKQNRVFALGNCGVKNPNASWSTYALGLDGAYANADLIMNSIIEWTVQLNPIYHYYDNYLDFAPYSTASLYIPYIGTQVLPINIIQSTKDKIVDLKLSFRLNCTNGDLICILMVDGVPMTHWNGNCARNIKVSVNDDSQAIREGVNGILSMVSMNLGKTGMYSTSMSAGQVNDGNANIIDSHTRSSTSSGSLSVSGVPSVPSAITSSQHLIGSSCSTGELGWIDSQNIYLTVERPQWWRPNDYGDLIGYPTKKIARLGSIKGFAKVIQCHVKCSGTTSEKEELMGKLAEGVIF